MAAPAAKKRRSALTLSALAAEVAAHAEDDSVLQRLQDAGLASEVAAEKRGLFQRAAQRLLDEGLDPLEAVRAYWVPGRIEVAGKHTDYAGGRSLLCATSRGFAVVSVDRADATCRIFTTYGVLCERMRKQSSLRVAPDLEPELGDWSAYPATVIRRLARNFGIDRGADIALECDLPEASGMSTSSAVICYMWMVLADRNSIRAHEKFKAYLKTDEELYSYLGFIENGQDCGPVLTGDKGVGTFGGSEDHTAIMSGEPGRLKVFSYCPTQKECTFSFPSDVTFVVGVSGALAHKTGDQMADYNNAAFLARDAAQAWCDSAGMLPLNGKTFVPGKANLAEIVRHTRLELGADGSNDSKVKATIAEVISRLDDGVRYGPSADSPARYKRGALRQRFEQFFDESEILTRGIAEALSSSDFDALGERSDESHRQTVECLQNTVPETAWLPQEARRLGALGSSAFGAGFGGSCWAVVRKRDAESFVRKWRDAYHHRFPHCMDKSSFFVMDPGPGAFALQ